MSRATLVVGFVAGVLFVTAAGAQPAATDHLKCYKVKDSLKLAALVDLNSPQLGLEAGCKVSAAKLFCVPVTKTVREAVNKETKQPIVPQPVSGPDPGDRVCYRIKCPESAIPDQLVTDQFGTRTVQKFKASMLCTPAVKGSPVTTTTLPCGGAGPTCSGSCPAGQSCELIRLGCICVTPPVLCGTQPACGGTCPQGMTCTPSLETNDCLCMTPPPP